jgi:hypothetical protein
MISLKGDVMTTGQRIIRMMIGCGIIILQIIASQLATFLVSLAIPGIENIPQTLPVLFVVILGLTYTIGIFGVGWLAIRIRWLRLESRTWSRIIGTLVGAYLIMIIALFTYHPVAPDDPLLFPVAVFTGIGGFYVGGWIVKK